MASRRAFVVQRIKSPAIRTRSGTPAALMPRPQRAILVKVSAPPVRAGRPLTVAAHDTRGRTRAPRPAGAPAAGAPRPGCRDRGPAGISGVRFVAGPTA